MNPKRARLFSVLLFLVLLATAVQAAEFWGSSKSDKYHFPSCRHARNIKPANLVVFKSPAEAVQSGYTPCKVCRPPVGQ